ncbi:amidohydrolase [Plectosphaerella plurivora]|uniref:Amidohydrolase n=1 Tax=Plectosphaerella plurivora TaxID=936078 RepID=A0A9P9AD05_9PEZI|nr:amidohydrolase [Plectosphaerella plurivora]
MQGLLRTGIALQAAVSSAAASTILFRGGTIVGWDESANALDVTRGGSLLIQDDVIVGIYPAGQEPDNLTRVDSSTEIIDVSDKIITPGFIDTHRHGWQTAFRTIGSNTSLWEYFGRYGEFAAEGLMSADDVYIGQLAGLYEALNAGVTTTLDHAHHTWSNETSEAGLQASVDSGARVFWAYAFHELQNYTLAHQYGNFRDLANAAAFEGSPTTLGIAYDAFNTADEAAIQPIADLIRDFNISVITTHYVSGPWGIDNSPKAVHGFGLLNTTIPVVFSHASFIPTDEYELLRQTDQHVSITPESEMHYGHLHPTAHLIMDQASLGVDTHFTFSTDILTQARLWLQRVRAILYNTPLEEGRIPVNNPMSANQAFLLATRNGARSLRRDDIGVIAPGAKADVVVWDGTSPALLGWVDPVAAVMLHASVADVEHVLVDGRFKKRDGKLVVRDYRDVKTRFVKSARRVQEVMINRPLPQPEGTWMTGAALDRAPEADVVVGDSTGYGTVWL